MLVASNVVWVEPSPQSTSTAHGLSGPGSRKRAKVDDFEAPSSAAWSAAAVTLGATLATATTCTDSESVSLAPSESVTLIFTLAVAGPSAKKQSKLPPAAR